MISDFSNTSIISIFYSSVFYSDWRFSFICSILILLSSFFSFRRELLSFSLLLYIFLISSIPGPAKSWIDKKLFYLQNILIFCNNFLHVYFKFLYNDSNFVSPLIQELFILYPQFEPLLLWHGVFSYCQKRINCYLRHMSVYIVIIYVTRGRIWQ